MVTMCPWCDSSQENKTGLDFSWPLNELQEFNSSKYWAMNKHSRSSSYVPNPESYVPEEDFKLQTRVIIESFPYSNIHEFEAASCVCTNRSCHTKTPQPQNMEFDAFTAKQKLETLSISLFFSPFFILLLPGKQLRCYFIHWTTAKWMISSGQLRCTYLCISLYHLSIEEIAFLFHFYCKRDHC